MNGGVCVSRKHCHCPPGFTGRLCQFPLTQTQQAQAAWGNKQPVYPISLKPDSLKLGGETSIGRTQMTHSLFTLPISQRHHSSEGNFDRAQVGSRLGLTNVHVRLCLFSVQINVRVHHHPDTSVFFHPLDQSDVKLPHKTGPRPFPPRHKPKGRCFQETTPKQAVSRNTRIQVRRERKNTTSVLYFPALVYQHAAARPDQPGGLLRQRGELMGAEQMLSVP